MKYYPKGNFKIGDEVRLIHAGLSGRIKAIRFDVFGDELFDLTIPERKQEWEARSTEIEATNVYSRREHRSA